MSADNTNDRDRNQLEKNKAILKRFNTFPRYSSSPLFNMGPRTDPKKVKPRQTLPTRQTRNTKNGEQTPQSVTGTPSAFDESTTYAATTNDDIVLSLQATIKTMEKTILELHKSQSKQDTIIESQNAIINDLRSTVHEMGKSIDYLMDKNDQLEQRLLSDRIVLSGPAVERFLRGGVRTDPDTNVRTDDDESVAPVQTEQPVALLSGTEQPSSEPNNDATQNFVPRPPIVASPEGMLANFLNETLGLSGTNVISPENVKYSSEMRRSKLLAVFRNEVPRVIYQNIRSTKKQLFCSDFLTRTRSDIMYELRNLKRDSRNGISLVTSRNGCPMARFTDDRRFHRIDTISKLRELQGRLERRTRQRDLSQRDESRGAPFDPANQAEIPLDSDNADVTVNRNLTE